MIQGRPCPYDVRRITPASRFHSPCCSSCLRWRPNRRGGVASAVVRGVLTDGIAGTGQPHARPLGSRYDLTVMESFFRWYRQF